MTNEEKRALAIELIEETIKNLEGISIPFEVIANLDIALEIIEEIYTSDLDDEIESEQQIDVFSHIEYDIIN